MLKETTYLKIEGDDFKVTFCEVGPNIKIFSINSIHEVDNYFKDEFINSLKAQIKKDCAEFEERERQTKIENLNNKLAS